MSIFLLTLQHKQGFRVLGRTKVEPDGGEGIAYGTAYWSWCLSGFGFKAVVIAKKITSHFSNTQLSFFDALSEGLIAITKFDTTDPPSHKHIHPHGFVTQQIYDQLMICLPDLSWNADVDEHAPVPATTQGSTGVRLSGTPDTVMWPLVTTLDAPNPRP